LLLVLVIPFAIRISYLPPPPPNPPKGGKGQTERKILQQYSCCGRRRVRKINLSRFEIPA
jgi:hypothetical protein